MVLLLFVFPFVSSFLLDRLRLTTAFKDLILSRGSILLYFLGVTIIAISPTAGGMILGLLVFTLGTGLNPALRSLITSLVEKENVGKLYTAIALSDTVGALIGGPGLAAAYRWGMKNGVLGLPFLVGAGLFASVAGVLFMVRLETVYEPVNREEDDEEEE